MVPIAVISLVGLSCIGLLYSNLNSTKQERDTVAAARDSLQQELEGRNVQPFVLLGNRYVLLGDRFVLLGNFY